jgi:predicted SAM-dependent methyltransferase
MKLNIGGSRPAPGWTCFNILPGPHVDFVGDCRDLGRFADGSIETIYASHVLEHVEQKGILPTLKEWHRVLEPGGTVMLSVPDLETLCRLFLDPRLGMPERFHVMRMMFGGQVDAHDLHLIGLSWEFLGAYLNEAGFRDIARVKDLGVFDDTSRLVFRGVPVSLNVTARKPAAAVDRPVQGAP